MRLYTTESSGRIKAISVSPSATLREAETVIQQAALNGGPNGVVIVVDESDRLKGIVTREAIEAALANDSNGRHSVLDVMIDDLVVLPGHDPRTSSIGSDARRITNGHSLHRPGAASYVIMAQDGYVVDVIDSGHLRAVVQTAKPSVAIIGLGFAGLTLGVSLAGIGFNVYGIEIDDQRVQRIRKGVAHLRERGLQAGLRESIANEKFRAETTITAPCDVYVIAVGTPVDEGGRPILEYVRNAAESVGSVIKSGDLVLIRSTVPVGTTGNLIRSLLEKGSGLRCGKDFKLAFAPERTVEGNALEELRTLPQIIGGYDEHSERAAAEFFESLTPNIVRVGSLEAAEMIKLVNNSFRDLSFAFANELANICDLWGLDAFKIVRSANEGYPRNRVPLPSPGVGGPCLTKDPHIFAAAGSDRGYTAQLPLVGRAVNDTIVDRIAKKIERFCVDNDLPVRETKTLIVGFAFKGHPETSDVRNSPTLRLLSLLQAAGFEVHGYDPVVPGDDLSQLDVRPTTLAKGFEDASVVVVMNNHPSYADIPLSELLPRLRRPAMFFDGWRLWDESEIERVDGVLYQTISGTK